MNNLEFLIPIALFFMIGFLAKIGMEHKTMRLLINRGENVGNLKEILENMSKKTSAENSMKWGLVLMGVGAAFIVARFFPPGMRDEMTVSFMFLLAGFGLILYYFLWGKEKNEA